MAEKDVNFFEHAFGNETFTFFISDEDATAINTQDIKPYLKKYRTLVDKARNVLNTEKMFGDVDVEELSGKYAFRPFKYQISNVEKMLNRFRGRGVFGDQVGLGKTIEALMTAHAMFESGAIRNALFVVDHKTIPGWLNEILTKFTGIFKVYIVKEALDLVQREVGGTPVGRMVKKLSEHSPNTVKYLEIPSSQTNEEKRYADIFEKLIARIQADNNETGKVNSEFRIYIITEKMLSAAKDVLSERLRGTIRLNRLNEPVKEEYLTVINGLIDKINNRISSDGETAFRGLFKTEIIGTVGGDRVSFGDFLEKMREMERFSAVKELKARLDEALGNHRKALNESTLKKATKIAILKTNIKTFEELAIGKVNELASENDETYAELQNSVQLMSGDIIDLMVIDEIHKIYETRNDRPSKKMVEILSKLKKKFCVLISATPVRTKLDDIFELLYIANPKMFGNKRYSDAKNYFYQTLCRIGAADEYNSSDADSAKYPLADMLLVDDAISTEQLKIFLGLVNGFFTRKRIKNVECDMKGIDDTTYGELDEINRRIVNSIKSNVIHKRAIMHAQEGFELSYAECIDRAQKEWNEWFGCKDKNAMFYEMAKKDLPSIGLPETEENAKELQATLKRHFFAAIDATLIEIIGIVDALILKHSQGELIEELDDISKALVGELGKGAVNTETILKTMGSRISVADAYHAFVSKPSININSDVKALVTNVNEAIRRMITGDAKGLRDFKRALYSMIDWSRRKKYGLGFIPNEKHEAELMSDGSSIRRYDPSYGARLTAYGARALNLMESMSELLTSSDGSVTGGKFVVPGVSNALLNDPSSSVSSEYDDDFFISLHYDTVMAYLNNQNAVKDVAGVIKILSDHYMNDEHSFKEFCGNGREVGIEEDLSVKDDVNRFVFFDDNYKAGVNLQQYKSFVFFQMEDKDHNLLSPADIEQWVGRIHRTGQVKNCRIVTVIDHSDKEKYSPEFLRWYYEDILSDSKGLDLYGNDTPDIAFIQPIVSDFVRQALQNSGYGDNLRSLGFADLAKKCYDYDRENGGDSMKRYMKYCIQLLRIYGFGDAAISEDPKAIINHIKGSLKKTDDVFSDLSKVLQKGKKKKKAK